MEFQKVFSEFPQFQLIGETGLLMRFGSAINTLLNARIRRFVDHLESSPPRGMIEALPSYCALTLIYDPVITGPRSLKRHLLSLYTRVEYEKESTSALVEVPVCYGLEFGPDLNTVAEVNGKSPENVIEIHSSSLYPVYMIGFAPGFPYLGGLPETIHAPRLKSPRIHVPAGSVGIANDQTGIYPVDSPGGWQIIGRCPLKLFHPEREVPILFKAGDTLKFIPITPNEFKRIKETQL